MFGQDAGPGTLAYVTRQIIGDILTTTASFDKKEMKTVRKETKVKEPVIVFMANGTSIVMSAKEAEKRGFFEQPEIMNFDAVTDQNTPAGRYKFSINMKKRLEAFKEMEQRIISRCVSKHGQALPAGATYSDDSVYLGNELEAI